MRLQTKTEIKVLIVPIWIELKGVPLELQTREGLSCIANVIGIPLYMDRATKKFSRVNFVKVCVEVEVTDVIPEFVEVEVENDSSFNVDVLCHWKPITYQVCGPFGHNDENCAIKAESTKEMPMLNDKPKKTDCQVVGSKEYLTL